MSQHEQQIARELLDDGKIGDFMRGECGTIACDDTDDWVLIASAIISELAAGIDTVINNNPHTKD